MKNQDRFQTIADVVVIVCTVIFMASALLHSIIGNASRSADYITWAIFCLLVRKL